MNLGKRNKFGLNCFQEKSHGILEYFLGEPQDVSFWPKNFVSTCVFVPNRYVINLKLTSTFHTMVENSPNSSTGPKSRF